MKCFMCGELDERIEALESERDALKESLAEWQEDFTEMSDSRDTWRSLAEGLAEALKEAEYQVHQQKYGACLMTLEDASKAYDAAKRGTK